MEYYGYTILLETLSQQSLTLQEHTIIRSLITNVLTLHNLIDVFFKFEDRLKFHNFWLLICYKIINSNKTRLFKSHTIYKKIDKEIQDTIFLQLNDL